MDKIFKAIGRFFKAIWDWIKTTAWIQPLLIVVIIFAIIFSFSANSPLMQWIKSLTNSDTTGEFYDKHDNKLFVDLYDDIYVERYQTEDGKKPDGTKCGTLLNDDGKTTYILFINSDTMENTIKTFYNNILSSEEQKRFYVIDFRNTDNLESEWNFTQKAFVNDNGKVFYNYLLNHLSSLFDSEEYDNYSEKFNDQYGYDAKPKNMDTWNPSSDYDSAVNDLKFPTICKYVGEELIDFRFLNSISSDYDKSSIDILKDFHSGLTTEA